MTGIQHGTVHQEQGEIADHARNCAEEVAVREQNEAETPVVWALAGAAPQYGCSTAAFLLGSMAAQSGRETLLFRPGQWDLAPKHHLPHTSPIHTREMAGVIERLNEDDRASAEKLYRRLDGLHPELMERPLWLIDMGCSRSHAHWDLFWSCDLSLVIAGNQHEPALRKTVDSAWHRWLERALILEDESLHALLQRADCLKMGSGLDSFLSHDRLRQAGVPGPIYSIVMHHNSAASPRQRHKRGSKGQSSIQTGPEVLLAGTLSCDMATALLIRDLHAQFRVLPHTAHVWLLNRLENRFHPKGSDQDSGRAKTIHPVSRGFYTQIGNKQILNIDLNYFDVQAVVSPFGATDDAL